jgi:hypothetical protein
MRVNPDHSRILPPGGLHLRGLGFRLGIALVAIAAVVFSASAQAEVPKPVTLPAVACPGTDMTGQKIPPPRSALTTRLPANVASKLSFYGAYGSVVVLAPRGWKCTSVSGSNGVSIEVVNPKAGFWGVGTYKPQEAVSLYEASTGSNHPLYLACPFFEVAKYKLKGMGLAGSCARPTIYRERLTIVSPRLATFDDPPRVVGTAVTSGGRNPASRMVAYDDLRLRASSATCTLPARQRALCAAILNEYRARWSAT